MRLSGFRVWLLAACLPVCLSGCAGGKAGPPAKGGEGGGSGESTEAAANESDRYSNLTKGFSIVFPADWEMMESYQGTAVTAFGPATDEKSSRPMANVVVEMVPETTTLKQYYERSLTNLASLIPRYRTVESAASTVGKLPAMRLVSRYELGGRPVAAVAYFVTGAEKAYVLTFACEAGELEQHKELFDQTAATFRVEQPAPAAGAAQ